MKISAQVLILALSIRPCAAAASDMDTSAAGALRRFLASGYDTQFLSPFDGSVYPNRFPPPKFHWRVVIEHVDFRREPNFAWRLRISEAGKSLFEGNFTDTSWTPPHELWDSWAGKTLTVELRGERQDGFQDCSAPPITVKIDTHVLPDDVLLRSVESVWSGPSVPSVNISYLWVDPTNRKTKELLSMNSETRCLGCHSVDTKNDSLLFVQQLLDGPLEMRRRLFRYGPNERDSGKALRLLGPMNSIQNSRLSPAGDVIACPVVTSSRNVNMIPGEVANFEYSQTFEQRYYPPLQDIVIYDLKTDGMAPLPGASRPDYSEVAPVWSPDGKKIAFGRYRYQSKLDIYTLDYNGGKGGTARPLRGASGNGLDNYFPEYSPDGRWIAFTRGDAGGGTFARDTSDIYLVPAQGGAARRLEFNVDGVMDSWHSWSSDSRWLLYSSKRGGITTKAYIARIGEDGRASAPVELECGLGPGQRVNMPYWIKKGEPAPISGFPQEAPSWRKALKRMWSAAFSRVHEKT